MVDFTAPGQLQVVTFGLTVINTAGLAKTVTATLSAIATTDATNTEPEVPKYLLNRTISVTGSFAVGATPTHATRTDYSDNTVANNVIFLTRGVTYRIELSTPSAVAVDRAYAYLLCRSPWRRA
jgi:spore maturation protein SpmB